MLAEVADLGIRSFVALSLLKFEYPCKDFKQGRLSGTVGADKDGALHPLDGQVEPLVDFALSL